MPLNASSSPLLVEAAFKEKSLLSPDARQRLTTLIVILTEMTTCETIHTDTQTDPGHDGRSLRNNERIVDLDQEEPMQLGRNDSAHSRFAVRGYARPASSSSPSSSSLHDR